MPPLVQTVNFVSDTHPVEVPRSICLVRLSALGDVCNTIPVARSIRRNWPETALTWVIGRSELALVRDLPGIEFIVVDKRQRFSGLLDVRRQLAGRRFDMLLLAQVSQRASIISTLIRAERRIGFDHARSRPGHGLRINERIMSTPFEHQALALQGFARHLGITPEPSDRRLPVSDEDRAFARHHQPEVGRAVIISPSSSHAARNWHAEGYAEVADWIIENARRPVILAGGPAPAEQALGRAIEGHMRHSPLNLIGRDTLGQAVAMLERAACLISPDSGPVHFADAMDTPVVGLYAATWARRSGPLSSLAHTVDRYPEAARQFAGMAPEQLRWGKRLEIPGVMKLITPGMVIEKLEPLLLER